MDMDLSTLESSADRLVAKIKHYLMTRQGKLYTDVSDEEIYDAFSMALREEVMINWTSAFSTYQKHNVRMLYYLSMEYLPGKILENTLKNLHTEELCRLALKKLDRDFFHIIHTEREPGLGNGGLGRLASCYLDSLATLKIPAIGYGLRYQYGTFEQEICYGEQIERPDRWLLRPHPWEFRRDYRDFLIKFGGRCQNPELPKDPIHDDINEYEEIRATCYDMPIVGYSEQPDFSVVTLRLWSTKESPQNFRLQTFNAGNLNEAAENMILTDVLYPNDHHDVGKRIRLKQEYLLVSASLQDILRRHLEVNSNLDNLAEKACIQINDTHPALIISEMMRILIDEHQMDWNKAWDITQNTMNYTNHTVMSEALEEWPELKLRSLLPRQHEILLEIDKQFKASLNPLIHKEEELAKLAIIFNERIRMANLSIYGSKRVNGVAGLHTDILKADLFKDFHELYPDKFLNVTNGVTQRRWLFHANPELSELITKKIGKGWLCQFDEIIKLREFAKDKETQEAFLEIKRQKKEQASAYIANYHEQFRAYDPYVKEMLPLGPDSLFDLHIKRIHEYKRQLLKLLHLIILYQELLENKRETPIKRTAIFAGKAAPGYEKAKDLIYLIHIVARTINQDPRTNGQLKVLFIENYNVTKAEILIPAADLSEQISLAGKEASGTGNMKLSMNGALTIGTEDGANIEMRRAVGDDYWPFRFGALQEEIKEIKKERSYYPTELIENDEQLKRLMSTFKDDTFAKSAQEKELLKKFHHYLVEGFNPDPYFVLYDLKAYYETQKKVEKLYQDPYKWAEYALYNIASMSPFSSDRSIKEYAEHIWKINPQTLDPQIHQKVKQDFFDHSK